GLGGAGRGVAVELLDPRSRESGRQLSLLADIEKKLRSGSIGVDEPSAAAYCAAIALGELDPEGPQASERYRGNPLPRVQAVFLLGQIGSPAYRPILAEALERDSDEAVRGAACDALAAIGVDPGGVTAAAFLKAAARSTGEQVGLALIENMERMALSSGSSPGEDAVRALMKLADEPFARIVRDRATTAMERIAGAIR
ncbi:MAG: HEAT repeat domain-containing protein, partial [Spirochaetaceae bacterium]|nr:HEAT repeat domain-containing protein [Spirochaetaceae bacterium]